MKRINNLKVLRDYYKDYALMRIKSISTWKEVEVENTEPVLKVKINKRCIEHWEHDSNSLNKRKLIIAIQGLPFFIQKMKNITPKTNQKENKINVEYLYEAECPNVTIEDLTGKSTHTIVLTIIKYYGSDHQAYSWYVSNLAFK